MIKTCKNCETKFEVTDADMKFYEKVSPEFGSKKYQIPAPTLCPDCRRQRRYAFRNERNLYHRKCDLTGKQIISIYSSDKQVTVYNPQDWWEHSAKEEVPFLDFNFEKTFLEQFQELLKVAPRPSLHILNNENCNYVNQCGYSKNCYLSYDCDYSEDCYYCSHVIRSKDCLDLFNGNSCELCYDSNDLKDCYGVIGSSDCKGCNDLYFCKNLIGCSDCFGSINLSNQKFYFFNQKLTEAEYKNKLQEFGLTILKNYLKASQEARQAFLEHPHKYAEILQCENVIGDYLNNCRNTTFSFDSFNDQDLSYCTVISNCKDSLDLDVGGYDSELCLDMISGGDCNYRCAFGSNHWGHCQECLYCELMKDCEHCLGCIGLRKKKYCILNKQYTKEEYEELVPKIIEHMQKTHSTSSGQAGEWGEFFPVDLSPFAYNETVAQEYFPLTKEEALAKGYEWKEEEDTYAYQGPKVEIPDSISEVSDEICDQILSCEECSKHYKIIKQELKFYRKMEIPVPRKCPNCRHANRMALRNPRKLWNRKCDKCGKDIQTSYAPDRPETVYCEECYLKEVY